MERTSVRNYIREYCSRSSVHGVQYIGEKKRPFFERLWWFFVFVVSLSACAFTIREVYKKWEQSPVIINFANTGTPTYEIPFPAVTVCSESKSDEDAFNYTKIMHKIIEKEILEPLEITRFEYMSLLCDYYPRLYYSNKTTFPEQFFDVINELKPKFEIKECSFLSLPIDCSSMFVPIVTSEGICYTFNMIDRGEIFREDVVHYKNFHRVEKSSAQWTLQNGYEQDAKADVYPYRALLSGATYGLNFIITTPKKNQDYACKKSVQGYRIVLHTPMTIPWPSQKFFRIPLHQNVAATIKPVRIATSKRIEAYSPKRRNCYFAHERHLKYFQKYTSSNCKLECLTNYTLQRCQCVNFFMPRQNGSKICGIDSIVCMKLADRAVQMVYILKNLKQIWNTTYEDIKGEFDLECDCLPICSDLHYEAETTETDWNWNTLEGFYFNLTDEGLSIVVLQDIAHKTYFRWFHSSVNLFFKSDDFFSSERHELYGPIDFLANFGGLLGLFTGFSVLSLMEVLYFLSVRLICNRRLHGRWTDPEN
ncbi:ASC domain containing protein [Asbolus verrucosus]|uniref:ASC domain containing protein n=1 Tax=Asbolus verrucosus TaxID=1661398 RepID=A0A482WAM2_ASBVE|nr:ASC domain containing protein [Asbolus verrucosus]